MSNSQTDTEFHTMNNYHYFFMKKFIFYKIIDLLAGKFIVQRIKKQALMSLLPVTNLLSSD
ncbi:conserved hypothetical protein [Vibrio aestuarianus]|uniref:Uncharacterized protein n=1 Tax=Vibrio aestuarianus TaxID=28171 RepID=A0ABN8TQK4_9VIBR|nr:hypothetical protein ACS86_04040 [Vibrio alginolyticus]CAH8187869.1 conserved hypothetical protein [Vibrio aestuarianus]CAH8192243.1 hypothetical protein VIBAE_A30740 [Vibrio aestuarianus subsp. francensis]CAH8192448.1 conserved hypothetical protein [Vibrio aestuarianus]CAH8192521.1 conserved hypothetical protein [Vibrio aestuarianus]